MPPRLMAITPADSIPPHLASLLPALSQWIDAIHLRWPGVTTRQRYEWARTLAAIAPRPLLIMNDRVDLALAAGLDGVHLREDGLAPRDLPPKIRPPLVGVSRHGLEGVLASEGADYLTVSPLRPTPSKPASHVLGEEGLVRLCGASKVPVLGLGGIEPEDLGWVLGAGAWGVAVLRGILGAENPVARARSYREALTEALEKGMTS